MSIRYQHILLTLLSRLSILLAALIISIVTARFLGPVGRGQYFYVYSLSTLLSIFANLGLQSSNTYLVAQDHTALSPLMVNSFWVSLTLCSFFAGIAILILTRYQILPLNISLYLFLLAPLYLYYLLLQSLSSGVGKIPLLNFIQFFMNISTVLIIFLTAYLTHNLQIILSFLSLTWLGIVIIFTVALHQNNIKASLIFDWILYQKAFRYSLKAYLIGIFTLTILRANIFILQQLDSFSSVGYFSIVAQMNDAISLLPASIAIVLLPHLIKSKEMDTELITDMLKKVSVLLLIGLGILWFSASFIIRIGFGSAYLPAIPVLKAMIPAMFFSSLMTILMQFMAARHFPISVVIIWFCGLIINIFLAYFCILHYGTIGAAMASSLTYALLFVSLLFVFKYTQKNEIFEEHT